MNELRSALKHKKPNPVKDAAGLASLIGFLNDNRITGAVVPKGEQSQQQFTGAEVARPAPVAAALEPTPKQVSTQQPIAAPQTPAPVLSRVFLTGRFKSGKDYVAERAGCKIFALADPLYFLAHYFFGKQPKDNTRAFLQQVGQWGRGTVNADYPLTPERAMFVKMIRTTFSNEVAPSTEYYVDWNSYGVTESIWLDSLIMRMAAEPEGAKIAVSGVRFQNEYARLAAAGFVHFHVMTGAATWTARLNEVNLLPNSPECKDTSEQLAAGLDQSVIKQLSAQPKGGKLRAIWSDDKIACPSPRLLTVAEFVAMFPK